MEDSKPQASIDATANYGPGNTISRCSLENCTTVNSKLHRCRFIDCVLSNVKDASRSEARGSQLLDVTLAERSDIGESTIQSESSVRRSDLKKSIVQDKSSIERSDLKGSIVSRSEIQRTTLTDCDVTGCVISRCSFKGMILKYGIWKKGVLVGKTGDMEPVQVKRDGVIGETSDRSQTEQPMQSSTTTTTRSIISGPGRPLPDQSAVELGGKAPVESVGYLQDRDDRSDDTDESDTLEDDLPPPYELAVQSETEASDAKISQH